MYHGLNLPPDLVSVHIILSSHLPDYQTAEYGTFRRDLGCGKPGQLISGAQNHFQVRKNICRQGSGALWVRPLRCGRPSGLRK